MSCGYCNWTSLDIGWQFKSLQDMRSDIGKLKIGGDKKTAGTKSSELGSTPNEVPDDDPDSVFATLRSFYNSQLATSNNTDPLLTPSGGFNYSSPSSLARIMSLYTGKNAYGKRDHEKSAPMRESADASEGLRPFDPSSDSAATEKLRKQGWIGAASIAQEVQQRHPAHFTDELRPTQVQLRTKRSKRCRTCRHILVKPESKVQSTRFRIRLVAVNYIPSISLKPLQLPSTDLNALPAFRASQFLLTLKNPLFDPVRITLATPTHTPGKHDHKITMLCPQFDIGSNIDQWDEALADTASIRESKTLNPPTIESAGGDSGKVAEAGKVWQKGRNWTTVVMEVDCADVGGADGEADDEDVLEIPILLRMEWEGDVERDDGEKEGKEKRELAFWVVVGVGRVVRLQERAD
ncbi:hypothetical protein MMC21_002130 [Puttea exsequens]|nr:hypothetical protein [Puttea exsequens]